MNSTGTKNSGILQEFLIHSGYPTQENQGVVLGRTPPRDMPDATKSFIDHWVSLVDRDLNRCKPFSVEYSDKMDNRLITYDEFLELFSDFIPETEYLLHRSYDYYMIDSYAKKVELLNGIKKNYTGYIQLLQKSKSMITSFLMHPIEMKIPLDVMERHMHILAKTGQGKSNLIKLILHELHAEKSKKKRSIILIEPHGDLAKEVRDFALNIKDPYRMVYIDPFYKKNLCPVINPFEIEDISDESLDLYGQELTRVFVELLKDGTTLSSQMEAILRPAISTLLRMKNSTLEDLQDLMDTENESVRARIVNVGVQNPYSSHRKMFTKVWGRGEIPPNYKPTLNSIYNKVQNLLNTEVFRNLTCGNDGKSTINLEQEVNSGKVIIFNLSKGKMGSEASQVYGKFIVSILQTIAFKRAHIQLEKRVSTFVFIDEFQNYVTRSIENILSEARKYKLHLILSHQSIGQISDTKLRDTLLGNTGIKAIGLSSKKTLRMMADEINISIDDFQELQPYEFYIDAQSTKMGKTSKPYRIKPLDSLTKWSSKYFQTTEEQRATLVYQCQRYYAPIKKYSDTNSRIRKDSISQESKIQERRPKFDL